MPSHFDQINDGNQADAMVIGIVVLDLLHVQIQIQVSNTTTTTH